MYAQVFNTSNVKLLFKTDDVVKASTSRGTAIIYKRIVCNVRDLRWKDC